MNAANAIATMDAGRAQCGRNPRNFVVEISEAEFDTRAGFTAENNCRPLIPVFKKVPGKVQAAVGKPLGARHFVAILENGLTELIKPNVREIG